MCADKLAVLAARAYRHMRPWTAGEFDDALARADSVLVAEDLGFVLGWVLLDEAEIAALAVDPAAQRKGHAARLLRAFEAAVARQGAAVVFLECAVDNAPARALYHAAGYAEVGRRRNYYRRPDGTKDDAVCLRKTLTPGHDPADSGESSKSG